MIMRIILKQTYNHIKTSFIFHKSWHKNHISPSSQICMRMFNVFFCSFINADKRYVSEPKVSPCFFCIIFKFSFISSIRSSSSSFTSIILTSQAIKGRTEPTENAARSVHWLSNENYSLGASTGQAPAHAPQEMHSSSLITYFPSTSEIALTGHSSTQVPQPTQVSRSILYAMIITSKI